MMEGPRLTALVASRICHDLLGPVSAIIQGLEMVQAADGGKNADALGLLEHGATNVWAKLDYFRFAFASAFVEGEGPLDEGRAVAEKLFSTVKPTLAWNAPDMTVPRPATRVVMNLLLIAIDCLPRGGQVAVEADAKGEVRIVATGQRAMLKAETQAALRMEAPADGFKGHNVQPFFAALLAQAAEVTLLAREAPERIELVARSPAFTVARELKAG
jgi:histidine phosphotransferase ChpT